MEKDIVDQIHWRLTQLHNMGYKMTDEFVAKMIGKYCVDVAPFIVKGNNEIQTQGHAPNNGQG